MRLPNRKIAKWVVWALLGLPAIGLGFAYTIDALGYGRALAISGEVSALLLLLALIMGAARRVLWRRAVGVASFGWAVLHVAIYLLRKWQSALEAALDADLLTGWMALAIFLPLAVTSTTPWVRRLGPRWRKLHLWVWPAAALVAAHWWMTAFDATQAVAFSVAIGALAALRVYRRYR